MELYLQENLGLQVSLSQQLASQALIYPARVGLHLQSFGPTLFVLGSSLDDEVSRVHNTNNTSIRDEVISLNLRDELMMYHLI